MLQKRVFLVFLLGIVICSNIVFAAEFDVSISNSERWQDVYSTMLLSALQGDDSEFLVSTAHGPLLLNGISKENEIYIVSSRDAPFVFNYEGMVEGAGFSSVEEIIVRDANLELIEELPEISNFILVDNDYGYGAIAVAQYAKVTNSWVFLADRANIDEITQTLSSRDVDSVLLYGYVDREVREAVSSYDPDEINTGDKFQDNIEIFERFAEIADARQVVLTNGEFIEKEIMLGNSPVLFTGRENVPDEIRDYIRSSDIEIGVLIGNELISAATNIKRTAGIDVIAKFARGARQNQGGAVATVEGLDLFYLPSPRINLDIHSIKYNQATQMLEVTYESDSNVPAYFRGTLTVDSEGEVTRVGDLDPIFISPGDFKTIAYEDVSDINPDDVVVDVYTLYGEVATSLDRILEGRFEVDFVNVIDSCQIDINEIIYNKQKEMFFVSVSNNGADDCWIDLEMRDVIINDFETTIGTDEPTLVRAGKKLKIPIEQRMDEEDLRDNDLITVYGYYGQRQDSLVNVVRGNFELIVRSFSTVTWIIIVLIILIILLLILAFVYKRREDSF